MKTQFRAIALALAVLMSHASLAGETVPITQHSHPVDAG